MTHNIQYIAFSLLAGFALASCNETDAEKDRGSTPVVKYARVCDPEKSDSLIVAASLGSKIAFVGDNLGDVQQIWFNDQQALLNPVMVTSHTIIVDVPNVIPSEVNNTVRFVTSRGNTAEIPFQVTVPGPRIDKMDCEYTRPGERTVISGAYFANDPSFPLTVMFGETEAEIVEYSQNSMTVIVPEGATECPITVSTIYGSGKSPFHYADTRGMLFDFEADGATGLGIDGRCWHNQTFVNDELSLTKTYLRLGDGATTLGDDTWDDGHFHFEYWSGDWSDPISYPSRLGDRLFDIVDFTDFKNMSLKFEMLIPTSNPWQTLGMQLIFSGTDKITYSGGGVDVFGNTVAGSNNSYFNDDNGKAASSWGRAIYIPWSETEAYHTGDKWITVSVPLSDFIYNSVGGKASASPASASDFANFEMFVWSGGVKGVESTPIICIDNIRAVRN